MSQMSNVDVKCVKRLTALQSIRSRASCIALHGNVLPNFPSCRVIATPLKQLSLLVRADKLSPVVQTARSAYTTLLWVMRLPVSTATQSLSHALPPATINASLSPAVRTGPCVSGMQLVVNACMRSLGTMSG